MDLPTKSVLRMRVRADGTRQITGDPPDLHVFSARWVGRELGRLAEVHIVLTTDEGDVTYRLEGFEPDENGQPNLSAWVARRIDDQRTEEPTHG